MITTLLIVRLIPYIIAIAFSVMKGYRYLPIGITIYASVAVFSVFTPLPPEYRAVFASFAALFIMLHALELRKKEK